MANIKVPQKAKRRLVFLGPLAIFLIGYCLVTVFVTASDLYKLNKEEKELQTNLKELKTNAKSLKTEITKLQDKDYIARYARENYLYTKDGEYVIKVKDEDKTKETKTENKTENYIIIACAVIFLLIILFIIKKSKKKKKM